MEILATGTYYEPGVFGSIISALLIIAACFSVVAAINGLVEDEIGMTCVGVIGTVFAVVLSGVAWGTGGTEYVRHEAIVTDYNEVFKEGYEVVEKDGKITVIQKEKESDSE